MKPFLFTFLIFLTLHHSVYAGIDKLDLGPFRIGGAIRTNVFYKDWSESKRTDLDTIRVNLEYEWEEFIGSAEYRYYYYQDSNRDTHFIHHGWLGYKITETDQLHAGVHQVPFGIQPYASHNWFFQLPYYVGLEDDYDLGLKYIHRDENWSLQLAYYVEDEGQYFGRSNDSARYSYDLVVEGIDQNEEKNQFNIRYTYTWTHAEDHSTEAGISLQYGDVHNRITNDDGYHYAGALHINETWGRWNVMAEVMRYDYSLKNPVGIGDDYVLMGAYDFPYQIASTANIYTVGVSYTLPLESALFDSITFYDDFSFMDKEKSNFLDSWQNVLGSSLSAGNFFIYFDIASGRNHPWLGPVWTNGFSSGGDDDWHTRFNINIGFYI